MIIISTSLQNQCVDCTMYNGTQKPCFVYLGIVISIIVHNSTENLNTRPNSYTNWMQFICMNRQNQQIDGYFQNSTLCNSYHSGNFVVTSGDFIIFQLKFQIEIRFYGHMCAYTNGTNFIQWPRHVYNTKYYIKRLHFIKHLLGNRKESVHKSIK